MLNINKKSAASELSWFAKRFNALLVAFPDDITQEMLKKDDLCSRYDAEEVFEALKYAHTFLSDIYRELLTIRKEDENAIEHITYIFSKIDLIWAVCFYGKCQMENNEYFLYFRRHDLSAGPPFKAKTLPDSYDKSFENINDSGCSVVLYKNGEEVQDYRKCEEGILYFENRFTALGIYLFVQKTAQKKWYCEKDLSGNYKKKLAYTPVFHSVEPYYRADMRVFTCKDRLYYDLIEQMSGYSDELISYFKEIYDFVNNNYPSCIPKDRGIYAYISCSVSFLVDIKHRMLGQLSIGQSEDNIHFFTSLSGNEMTPFMERIDEFDLKVVGKDLLVLDHDRSNLENAKEITYRGEKYLFRNVTAFECRFDITCREDVKNAIKFMDIKGKCNRCTL